jgi:hypothetical protein
MSEIINFFVTLNGTPQIGLTPLPTITVYDSVTNAVVLTGNTQEVGGGFYKYVMPALSPTIDYVIVADAGSGFPDSDRYYYGEIDKLNDLAANTIWNYPANSSLNAGSFGALLNAIDNATSMSLTLIEVLIKFQENRTKVDPVAKTLTVYDDDQTTPLKIFNLYNNNGVLDINAVFERVPR